MTHKPSLQAADFVPGDVAYQVPTTVTAEVIALPAAYLNRFWTFSAETQDVYIRFGGSYAGVDVDNTADSTVTGGTGVLTEDTTTPHLHIPAGTEKSRRLPPSVTHFAHISAATGGKLRFAPTTGAAGTATK